MPITKDYMAQVARAETARESKDRRRETERRMLSEGKTHYSVHIESETKDFESFISGKTFHRWFWALTPEQAGEMALSVALTEGHKNPKIQSITVLKEAKKKKNG